MSPQVESVEQRQAEHFGDLIVAQCKKLGSEMLAIAALKKTCQNEEKKLERRLWEYSKELRRKLLLSDELIEVPSDWGKPAEFIEAFQPYFDALCDAYVVAGVTDDPSALRQFLDIRVQSLLTPPGSKLGGFQMAPFPEQGHVGLWAAEGFRAALAQSVEKRQSPAQAMSDASTTPFHGIDREAHPTTSLRDILTETRKKMEMIDQESWIRKKGFTRSPFLEFLKLGSSCRSSKAKQAEFRDAILVDARQVGVIVSDIFGQVRT